MRPPHFARSHGTFLATVWVLGCTHSPHTASAHPRTGDIIRSELERSAYGSAYEAIERLRPSWLWERGSKTIQNSDPHPVVYVDGMRRGGLSELYTISVDDVESISLISPADATTRWGTGHMSGVILVTTQRGGRNRGEHSASPPRKIPNALPLRAPILR